MMKLLLVWSIIMGGWLASAPAHAADCPKVEVIFARGTGEPDGVGGVGQDFIDAMNRRAGNVGVYAVNYPASMDFSSSTMAGIFDASEHVKAAAASCGNTRMILAGYSQGAAVAGFVTSAVIPDGAPADSPQPMDAWIANHVAAVVLFGTPNPKFMLMIGQPAVAVGALYSGKTIQLCIADDPVCSDNGGDWAAHSGYTGAGMTDQAANFAAAHI